VDFTQHLPEKTRWTRSRPLPGATARAITGLTIAATVVEVRGHPARNRSFRISFSSASLLLYSSETYARPVLL